METHGKQQQIGLHRRDLITTLTSVSFAVIIDVITTKKNVNESGVRLSFL